MSSFLSSNRNAWYYIVISTYPSSYTRSSFYLCSPQVPPHYYSFFCACRSRLLQARAPSARIPTSSLSLYLLLFSQIKLPSPYVCLGTFSFAGVPHSTELRIVSFLSIYLFFSLSFFLPFLWIFAFTRKIQCMWFHCFIVISIIFGAFIRPTPTCSCARRSPSLLMWFPLVDMPKTKRSLLM